MDKQEAYFVRNRLLQKIKHLDRFGNKEGYVKVHSNNSLEHEQTKLAVVHKLKNLGFDVWTECRFDSGRGDIVAIKEGLGYIIEILHSETKEQYELKKEKYPDEFTLIEINTRDFNIEEFDL